MNKFQKLLSKVHKTLQVFFLVGGLTFALQNLAITSFDFTVVQWVNECMAEGFLKGVRTSKELMELRDSCFFLEWNDFHQKYYSTQVFQSNNPDYLFMSLGIMFMFLSIPLAWCKRYLNWLAEDWGKNV